MRNYLTLIFFLFPLGLSAQVKFYAQTNATEVLEDSHLTYTIVIENARASNFKPPALKDFVVLSGPSQSNSTRIINGKRSSFKSFSYTLQPKRAGNLRIEAASAIVGGKAKKTNVIKVKVLKESEKSKRERKFFVESVVSDTMVNLGQQILIDYIFYSRLDQNINSINIQSEDDFEGFYALSVKDFDQSVDRKTIGGTEYAFQTVRKLALFPQKAGYFEIDPTSFIVYISAPNTNNRGFGSMFGSFKEAYTKTKGKSISVSPLPKAEPDFIGAVGNYALATSSNKTTISSNQSISMMLTVYGDGDPELMTPPVLNLDERLEVYEPNFVKEDKYVDQGRQKHKTTYEYLIVPREAGNYTINPAITYFNPDSNAYLSATSSPLNLKVLKASGSAALPVEATLTQRADKMYPFLKEVSLSKSKSTFFNSIPFWLCLGLLFSAYPVFGFLKYRQIQDDAIDPELIKSQNARKVAIAKLASAKSYMDNSDQRSFYNEISHSILGYASDKIKIPASELSKQNIADKLSSLNIAQPKVDAITGILQSCEMALFAGSNESSKMKETYENTIETISQIENELS